MNPRKCKTVIRFSFSDLRLVVSLPSFEKLYKFSDQMILKEDLSSSQQYKALMNDGEEEEEEGQGFYNEYMQKYLELRHKMSGAKEF